MRGTRLLSLLLVPCVVIALLPGLSHPRHISGDDLIAAYAWFDTVDLALAPAQPRNLLPAHGATDVSQTPTLRSSTFSGSEPGDTHLASQWQLRIASGDYSTPIYDSDTDAINLTSVTLPSDVLKKSTTYGWHVRHQGRSGLWSDWSGETLFRTEGKAGISAWIWVVVAVTALAVGAVAYVAATRRARRVSKPRSKPRYRTTP